MLRPRGRVLLFWNTGQPAPGLDEACIEVYRRVRRASGGAIPEDLFAQLIDGIGAAIDAAGSFTEQDKPFVVTAVRRP